MQQDPSYGKALFAFLEKEWAAMDIKPTAWCRKVGLADATVLRWRDGTEPDMRTIRLVAELLDRPIVQLLLAIGYLSPSEVRGQTVQPRVYNVVDAIKLDKTITPGEREALRQIHDTFAGARLAADRAAKRAAKATPVAAGRRGR